MGTNRFVKAIFDWFFKRGRIAGVNSLSFRTRSGTRHKSMLFLVGDTRCVTTHPSPSLLDMEKDSAAFDQQHEHDSAIGRAALQPKRAALLKPINAVKKIVEYKQGMDNDELVKVIFNWLHKSRRIARIDVPMESSSPSSPLGNESSKDPKIQGSWLDDGLTNIQVLTSLNVWDEVSKVRRQHGGGDEEDTPKDV